MDYYFITTSKEDFINDMNKIGLYINVEENYFQDEKIIVDWVGKIVKENIYDEDKVEIIDIIYFDGLHVNVRSVDILDIELFVNTFAVSPNYPRRMFS
jgi:hypothetical protein